MTNHPHSTSKKRRTFIPGGPVAAGVFFASFTAFSAVTAVTITLASNRTSTVDLAPMAAAGRADRSGVKFYKRGNTVKFYRAGNPAENEGAIQPDIATMNRACAPYPVKNITVDNGQYRPNVVYVICETHE